MLHVHKSSHHSLHVNIKTLIMDIGSEPCSAKNDEPNKSARLVAKRNVRGKHRHKESKKLLQESTREKKRFSCKECGLQMSESSVFEQHLKTHQGIKDFTCYECGKKFLLKKNVIRHQKTHLVKQSVGVKSIPIKTNKK
ncbi:uncharacterized protein [Dendrobates tinctorius]|uniref:uncharacterized protein isoform X3 n=1 Tax=Dendrobates tinctorius TaxID=92724 RepID=UPI003CC9C29A